MLSLPFCQRVSCSFSPSVYTQQLLSYFSIAPSFMQIHSHSIFTSTPARRQHGRQYDRKATRDIKPLLVYTNQQQQHRFSSSARMMAENRESLQRRMVVTHSKYTRKRSGRRVRGYARKWRKYRNGAWGISQSTACCLNHPSSSAIHYVPTPARTRP